MHCHHCTRERECVNLATHDPLYLPNCKAILTLAGYCDAVSLHQPPTLVPRSKYKGQIFIGPLPDYPQTTVDKRWPQFLKSLLVYLFT